MALEVCLRYAFA
ncbi:hypothetical protein O1B57_003552 [Vibrio cholerae]|nr:hypothetical protein [Vibrio cholerae]EKF9281266.1 hypothetical protein [Vibrio cholerae]